MIEIYVGFGVLILGIIFGIIAYLLKRMIEGFDKKIDLIDGKIEFLIIGSKTTDKDIVEIKKDVESINTEIGFLGEKYEELHTRVTVIETQHNRNHK